MKTESQKMTDISKILKKRFPNLTIDDVLDLAQKILNKLNEHS